LLLDYLALYLIGQNDMDLFPRNPDGTAALDMSTDLIEDNNLEGSIHLIYFYKLNKVNKYF